MDGRIERACDRALAVVAVLGAVFWVLVLAGYA